MSWSVQLDASIEVQHFDESSKNPLHIIDTRISKMFSKVFVLSALCVASALAKDPKVTNKVFFDVTIGGEDAGRIVMNLYVSAGTLHRIVVLFHVAASDPSAKRPGRGLYGPGPSRTVARCVFTRVHVRPHVLGPHPTTNAAIA